VAHRPTRLEAHDETPSLSHRPRSADLGGRRRTRCRRARRPGDLGRPHLARSDVVRSSRNPRDRHAVHGALRTPRRDAEGAARQPAGAGARRVVDRIPRWAHVRVRPAPRREVPQRRAGHRRGRQVLVRALSRLSEQDPQREDRRGRDSGSGPCPLPAEAAMARLRHVLLDGDRRRLDRAEEVRREGRRRRIQEGAHRRRPLPVRLVHARRRARHGGGRGVLAQDAEREAPGPARDSGSDHAIRRAQERRSTSRTG